MYTNPLYRVLDYLLGMVIAKVYIDKGTLVKRTANFIEFTLVLVFLLQYGLSFIVGDTPGYYSVLFTESIYICSW